MVPEQMLRECAENVIGSIEKIKACYGGSTTYPDFELAHMMVIDACFILEFIQSIPTRVSSGTNMLMTASIIHDLLLIENQIPFFVLEIIFECTVLPSRQMKEEASLSLTKYIMVLVNCYYFVRGNRVVPDTSAPDHILDFYTNIFGLWNRCQQCLSQAENVTQSWNWIGQG